MSRLKTKLARLQGAGPGSRRARVAKTSAPEDVTSPSSPDEHLVSEQTTQVESRVDSKRSDEQGNERRTLSEASSIRREMTARVDAIRRQLEAMNKKHRAETVRRAVDGGDESSRSSQTLGGASRSAQEDARFETPLIPPAVGGSEFASALLGETLDTEWGRIHRVRKTLRPSHMQGNTPVALALGTSSSDFARIALDPTLEGVDLSNALYFDTETTGLAGGCGTLPFLVGLAWFEGRSLVVEQLVLRQPGEEAPILERLSERIAHASCVVSYNGKSFDWPLLKTRYVMNRREPPELPPHIDLLHCARRVFKARLEDVSLTAVEEGVLGLGRVDDVGGGMIPECYSRFLAGAPGAILNPVIEHNAHDLISLAALLGDLGLRYRCDATVACASDQLGLAKTALRAHDLTAARTLAGHATEGGGDVARQAHFLASRLAKRAREFATARDHLCAALEQPGIEPSDAELCLALAKLYEHGLRDPTTALRYAGLAQEAEDEHSHQRRLKRLEKKRTNVRATTKKGRGRGREVRAANPNLPMSALEFEDKDVVFVNPSLLTARQGDSDPLTAVLAPTEL